MVKVEIPVLSHSRELNWALLQISVVNEGTTKGCQRQFKIDPLIDVIAKVKLGFVG